LTWRDTQNTGSFSDGSIDFNKKYNLDGAATFGLGNNLAFQYRTFQPESASTQGAVAKFENNEYNVLYKLNKGVSAFAGLVTAKGTLSEGALSISANSKNLWQVGVIGSTEIAPKTNLWGVAAAGTNWTNYEVGIGYEFTPNLEFNVNYREVQAKNLNFLGLSGDGKAKGLGFGLTFKY